MTDRDVANPGPAFARDLGGYRGCFLHRRTAAHSDYYRRGLLSNLPRKSVEPITRACGTAVRTLQEFLATADWRHEADRGSAPRHAAGAPDALAGGPVGGVLKAAGARRGPRPRATAGDRVWRAAGMKGELGGLDVHPFYGLAEARM